MKIKLFFAALWGLSPLFYQAGAQTYDHLAARAEALIRADSLVQAEQVLREAMRLEPANPQNVALFANLGLVLQRLGKPDQAIEAYGYALNLAPDTRQILLDRAALLLQTGQNDRAYLDYCHVLDLDPKCVEALLMRAYIYLGRKDRMAARHDYQRLLEIEPSHYSGRLGLAMLEQQEQKYPEALALIQALMNDHPEDAVLYMARADIEREMGHTDLALIDLDEAIRIDDQLADAYLLRGDVWLMMKKKEAAKADFSKAMELGIPQNQLRERLKACQR